MGNSLKNVCVKNITKVEHLLKYVTVNVAAMNPRGQPLAFLSDNMLDTATRGDPMENYWHPMWQTKHQEVTPWKICDIQCGRYGP